MKQRRVCLAPGYKYEYDGAPHSWTASSDERWDIVNEKAVCGARLGKRLIDGRVATVVQARGKVYASTHVTHDRTGLGRARRRR